MDNSPFFLLNYLQPTHYFRLKRNNGHFIFPVWEKLPLEIQIQISLCQNFQSELSKQYEGSYQATLEGYISEVDAYSSFKPVPLSDNYRFLRRYFHPAWIFYVMLIRILAFNNPFKEFMAWMSSKNERRIAFWEESIDNLKSKTASTVSDTQLVSVIIPTLNRYDYLENVLKDFETQTYKNFELIIVDQSDHFDEDFYKKFKLNIHVEYQKEKALWLARNKAVKSAKGDFIAFSEDDVRINADWIQRHLECLNELNADVSAGVFFGEGKSIPIERSYYTISSQFPTGNAMLRKEIFKTVGLFDRQFEKQRMGDGEFGLRLYLAGYKCISNPYAYCIDVKAPSGGLREMGSWDAFRPSKWWAPRPVPSVIYYYRRYFGKKATFLALLRTVPISVLPYQFKRNKFLLFIGVILSLLLLPIVLLQVMRSWNLANKKLTEGPKIEYLN